MNEIYEISRNDIFNRYLTASRFIKQGELILKESPLLIDPHLGRNTFCLRCWTYIKTNSFKICKQCKVATLCRFDCDGKFHSDGECGEMKKLNLKPLFLIENQEVITVLRLFLKQKYSVQEWKVINELESHLEERRNTVIWESCEKFIEKVMIQANILSEDDVKNEVAQKLLGILDVNTFEIRPPNQSDIVNPSQIEALRGLYPTAALMAHDCMSNTHLAVDNDFVLYIHASMDIKKGSGIYFNYANVLDGNIERNKCLKQGKYFECKCTRCSDPSELNTNISSLKCPSCRKGLVQPRKNNAEVVIWMCTCCKKTFHNSLIDTTLKLARNLINEAGSKGHLVNLERAKKKLQQTLHPQHHLILELDQMLMGLYTQDSSSSSNLMGKIESCRNVIEVTQILEPGISRILGITLYELHAAEANLAYKEYSENQITLNILLRRLLSTEEILRTALRHLLYEPKNSPEGVLAQNALSNLKKLRESISNLKVQALMENCIEKKSKKAS